MSYKTHFRLLFEFESWANRRALASIQDAATRGQAVRLMAHILAAQQTWLARLRGQDASKIVIWPPTTLEECAERLEQLNRELHDYVDVLDEAAFETPIEYRNQTGAEYRHSPLEILTHLTLHSQHHRGQIALQLRQLGQEPAVTDFIAFRRL